VSENLNHKLSIRRKLASLALRIENRNQNNNTEEEEVNQLLLLAFRKFRIE